MPNSPKHQLDVAEDLEHQRRMWKLERFGWVFMSAVLTAGLLGVLGTGPLSRATAGEGGSGLRVDYQRFVRYQARMELKIHVAPEVAPDRSLALWVNRQFLADVEVEQVSPVPVRVEAEADRFVYVFALGQGTGPVTVRFQCKSSGYGKLPVRLGVVNGPGVEFAAFVFP